MSAYLWFVLSKEDSITLTSYAFSAVCRRIFCLRCPGKLAVVPLSYHGLVRLRLDEAYFCCLCKFQAEGLLKPLREVEMPLVPVLAQMEAVGVAVDPTIFAKHKVTHSHTAPHPISLLHFYVLLVCILHHYG